MKESEFIAQNVGDWEKLEKLLRKSHRNADKLQQLFVKVSGDLSYASTFYPNRSVRLYLNKLTQQVFDSIEKESTQSFRLEGVLSFFRYTVPLEMYRSRKAFLLSVLIFVAAMIIGAVSTAHSEDFAVMILGDQYMSMTVDNINDGDPMAVYKDSDQVDMFMHITTNNIRVSFLAFVGGIFAGLGTLILLLYNGIMLGTFQYFFYQKGLLATSFFTIWIHGTIEIAAIIIAGAAGFVLGSGLLFPGTYKRGVSLQASAKRSVRIIVGIVPLFVIAGFLESFVTRLTDMPLFVKAFIILLSLALIIGVYVVYPRWVYKHHGEEIDYSISRQSTVTDLDNSDRQMSYGDMLSHTFTMYRMIGGRYFSYLFKWVMPVMILFFTYWITTYASEIEDFENYSVLYHHSKVGVPFFGLYLLTISFMVVVSVMLFIEVEGDDDRLLVYLKKHYFKAMLLVAVPLAASYFFPWWAILLVFVFLVSPQYITCSLYEDNRGRTKGVYLGSFYIWGYALLNIAILGVLHLLVLGLVNVGVVQYLFNFITWHDVFSVPNGSMVFFNTLIYAIISFAMLPLYTFSFLYAYKSRLASTEATDLLIKIESFGQTSSIFE